MYKNGMKFHMLMFMNAWVMLVLMKCKCQMQSLTLGCYSSGGGVGGSDAGTAVPPYRSDSDGGGGGVGRDGGALPPNTCVPC